jgi:predicted RNA-binding protein with PUA domain
MTEQSAQANQIALVGGKAHATGVALRAFLLTVPEEQRAAFQRNLDFLGEHVRDYLVGTHVPDKLIDAFDSELEAMRESADPN